MSSPESSEETPAPRPPRRRWRWLRRLVWLGFLVVVLLGLGGVVAYLNIDKLTEWSLERVFPGIDVKMSSMRFESITRFEVRELQFTAEDDGEVLLELQGGTVEFDLRRLPGIHLDEVRLEQPHLRVTPRLGRVLGIHSEPEPATAPANEDAWSIQRLMILDGTLEIGSFWDRTPRVTMRVSADWRNFGIRGPAGAVGHEVVIKNVVVRRGEEAALLEMESAVVGFTPAGLFSENRLESILLGNGRLIIPNDWNSMLPEQTNQEGKPAPDWTVGTIVLGSLAVEAGGAGFDASASMTNVSAENSSDVQSITLRRIRLRDDQGERTLNANRAEVKFTVAEALRMEFRRLRVVYPQIWLRPATGDQPTTAPGAPPGILFRNVEIAYGELKLAAVAPRIPEVTTKFAFEGTDVGTSEPFLERQHEIVVWDSQVRGGATDLRPFLTVDIARVEFTLGGLIRDRDIAKLDIDGGRLIVGSELESFLEGQTSDEQPAEPQTEEAAEPWQLLELEVTDVRTRLEDHRVDASDIDFTLNSTLRNVTLGGARDRLLEEVQLVEFANLDIRSPFNPDIHIVTLRSVFVRFTLKGLARNQIREVVVLRPTLYLSQDFFRYMERANPGATDNQQGGRDEPAWEIERFETKFGSLVIGSGGRSNVGLPLGFETVIEDVKFDNLAALKIRAALQVPVQSYSFDSYQLELDDVGGDLKFAYPPEKGLNNLVQKLDIEAIRWRQFEAGESWISVTFDAQGINGQFGGEAYGGYVNGGFSFFFQHDSPWIGWVAGTAIDTERLTDVLSPKNFSMTGPLDFEVQVDAFTTKIDRIRGGFDVLKPGVLRIGKLDDLINNIPADWPPMKQSLNRIGLETLRDFEYTDAEGDFWFVQSQGIFNLRLAGPYGSRNFEIALHQGADSAGRWTHGTMGGESE